MGNYYPHVLRTWIYPLAQRIQKRDYVTMMAEASKNQFLSCDELQYIQFRKLTALLVHVYKTVPYYRELFNDTGLKPEDIRTWDDFHQIPILTVEQYREKTQEFISSEPRTPIYPVRTSGSTGSPTKFYLSQAAAASANISRIRAQLWWGIELGDREIRVWPIPSGLDPGIWIPMKKRGIRFLREKLMNRRTIPANEISPEDMQRLWRFTKRYCPKYLFGYSSVLYNFAAYLKERGFDGRCINLIAVVASAEMLYDPQVRVIEDVFGCPVVNEYGSTEVGVIAYSFPCGELHTMDDFIIVEIIKSDPQNEFGEVVITQLDNWGSPLIRYNLQDLAVPAGDTKTCPAGLGFGKIKRVMGRRHDLIRLSNGRIVHGQFFSNLIAFMPSVRQFQVVQKEYDLFEIVVESYSGKVPNDEVPNDEERYIRTRIHQYLGPVEIKLRTVPNISMESSGKFRSVRSEVKQ